MSFSFRFSVITTLGWTMTSISPEVPKKKKLVQDSTMINSSLKKCSPLNITKTTVSAVLLLFSLISPPRTLLPPETVGCMLTFLFSQSLESMTCPFRVLLKVSANPSLMLEMDSAISLTNSLSLSTVRSLFMLLSPPKVPLKPRDHRP